MADNDQVETTGGPAAPAPVTPQGRKEVPAWAIAAAIIIALLAGGLIGWLICGSGKIASINAVKKEAAEACKADVKSAVDVCKAETNKALEACDADKTKAEAALAECQKNCQKPKPVFKKRPPKKTRAAAPAAAAPAAVPRYTPAPSVTCGSYLDPCPPTSQVLTGTQRFSPAPCAGCE